MSLSKHIQEGAFNLPRRSRFMLGLARKNDVAFLLLRCFEKIRKKLLISLEIKHVTEIFTDFLWSILLRGFVFNKIMLFFF